LLWERRGRVLPGRLIQPRLALRDQRLQFFAEAFNVVNHQNILSVNTSYSSYVAPSATSSTCNSSAHANGCIAPYTGAAFGSASSTNSLLFGPRQMQFTAKFIF